jgi:hypothetical protein
MMITEKAKSFIRKTMIKIYGASDDLIEITGDTTEEWCHYGRTPATLKIESWDAAAQQEDIYPIYIKVQYTRFGQWLFTPEIASEYINMKIYPVNSPEASEYSYYSELVVIDDDLVDQISLISQVANVTRKDKVRS